MNFLPDFQVNFFLLYLKGVQQKNNSIFFEKEKKMKKLITLVAAMLLVSVGIAGASDFSITGDFYVAGTYYENETGTATTGKDWQEYDMEMHLNAEWKMSPLTKVILTLNLVDDAWARSTATNELNTAAQNDDNIVVEKVYGQHTFMSTKTTIRVGLMDANAWATDFSDAGGEAYRVWAMQSLSFGRLFAILEKQATRLSTGTNLYPGEAGSITNGEDTDNDAYIVCLITKVGPVTLFPLVKYVTHNSTDRKIWIGVLGAKGAAGKVGYEGEFVYQNHEYGDQQGAQNDFELWGAYGNLWVQLNKLKVGGLIAYGSYDDTTGQSFSFGNNFNAGGALILGNDDFEFNNAAVTDYNALQAALLYAIYADYAINEKLSVGAYLGFADSTVDNASANMDGADAWEISADVTYKITNNLTYSVAAGIAELTYGNNTVAQPEDSILVMHMLSFEF